MPVLAWQHQMTGQQIALLATDPSYIQATVTLYFSFPPSF